MKKSSLKAYSSKRHLKKSKEPAAKYPKTKKGNLQFVIQKHAARRLHYDLRLEVDGVLKSWAVPKEPSLDPHVKRLAIMVEDHPYGYKDFEGVIPEGYGKGSVMIWDKGVYSVKGHTALESEEIVRKGLEKGEIKVFFEGKKIKGEFALVKLKKENNEWLLIKTKDTFSAEEPKTSDRKPKQIKPMLATLVDAPFDHKDWLFEIKLDGFRAIAELEPGQAAIYSRNLKEFNTAFPLLVNELKKMKLDAVLDGEIVALDEKGVPRFQLLQNRQSQSESNIYYYVFDLLYLDGKDLRDLPLIERKMILKDKLKETPHIRFLDHIENKGKAFLRLAAKESCEGIIGKLKQSTYKLGVRSKSWVKIKAYQRQEVVICGFTEPRKSRKEFGALIVGVYKNGSLQFAGHVGGGFTEKKLSEVKKQLLPFVQEKSPFNKKIPANTKPTWVAPKFLCEVRFSEWTSEGIMRQPIFLGLREDKYPKEVKKEKSVKTKSVLKNKDVTYDFLTHVDKIYWPKEKISKGEVLHYYDSVSQYLLPHLKDRPQSLKRYPEGIEGERFFQKNVEKAPSWVSTIPIRHKNKTVNYLLIEDKKSLLYAVNLGCIELHPWLSCYQNYEYPEFLLFDLDPEDIAFDAVVECARVLHRVLEAIDVPNYCKTSGATGLHVCVPLKAQYTYEQAKQFALMIATYVQAQLSSITSLERSPKQRQKKVYIDCLQNNLGQTIAAPYSLRALPGAPVSTPLSWNEVKPGLDPLDFNFYTMPKRIKKKGDLFKPLLETKTDLTQALKLFNSIL